jgi:hypothetical protein
MAIEAGIFAELDGNTMFENDAPAKPKHFSAQVAIDAQSPMTLSQVLALSQVSAIWGQQSGMSMADISVESADLTLMRAPAGSIATDRAIRSARMVRPMLMDLWSE